MARKTPSRLQLRKQVEAAEIEKKTASSDADGAKKKTATKKKAPARAKRTKVKAPQRKRLVWAVFSASMKEEARFAYDQRDAAEQKLAQLCAKSKKPYFIQPIKELIVDAPAEDAS